MRFSIGLKRRLVLAPMGSYRSCYSPLAADVVHSLGSFNMDSIARLKRDKECVRLRVWERKRASWVSRWAGAVAYVQYLYICPSYFVCWFRYWSKYKQVFALKGVLLNNVFKPFTILQIGSLILYLFFYFILISTFVCVWTI